MRVDAALVNCIFYANGPGWLRVLFHSFQGYRVLLGLAHSAVDSTGNDNGFIVAICRAIGMDDIGHFFRMRFAHIPAAKAAGSVGGSFTVPTFHDCPVRSILSFGKIYILIGK
jgi:hypothetical protein